MYYLVGQMNLCDRNATLCKLIDFLLKLDLRIFQDSKSLDLKPFTVTASTTKSGSKSYKVAVLLGKSFPLILLLLQNSLEVRRASNLPTLSLLKFIPKSIFSNPLDIL